jgi:hypothetical protein
VFQSLGAIRYLFWLKPAIVRDEEIGTIKKWLETLYDVAIDEIQIETKLH